jgi:hypothetical protein
MREASGGRDRGKRPRLVEVGALLAEAAGRIPIREVESDPVQNFGGKLGRVWFEGVGGETAEGAAFTCVKRGTEAGGQGLGVGWQIRNSKFEIRNLARGVGGEGDEVCVG